MSPALFCVFCLSDSPTQQFAREHIIPRCVGGTLFVDNIVCAACNARLGREVDCQILKMPQVLNAMDTLGLRYDRTGVLRTSYTSELVDGTARFKATPEETGFRLVPQRMEDGSLITPGHEAPVDMIATLLTRGSSSLWHDKGPDAVGKLCEDLKNRFERCNQDEEVTCEELGITLVKRSRALKGVASPKSHAAMDRLIAKISYEWLLSCVWRRFAEEASWAADLRDLTCGCIRPPYIHVFRSQPLRSGIQGSHSIHFWLDQRYTRTVVSFFGEIEFTLIAPPIPIKMLEDFHQETGLTSTRGIAFKQDLRKGTKTFYALLEDGSSKVLGSPRTP
ncbi:MAG: HNH endonuclease [Acidobacteriota bacterium]